MPYNRSSMPFQEVVEAEGHLIDSHIMENIFDKVVEYNGRFEVEQFRIGRTNSEPSYLRLQGRNAGRRRAGAAARHSCSSWAARRSIPAMPSCAPWSATAARRRISTPPPITAPASASDSSGSTCENQRMDAMIVVAGRPRDLPPAARPAHGRPDRGGAARHPRRLRNRRSATGWRSRSCRTASRRSARWRRPCARPRRWCATRSSSKQKVVVVAGPVVVHTGGVAGLAALIRGGWVHARAQRQRARRARCRSRAVRHVARRPPVRRPAGGARPSQSHARHQRDLSCRVGEAGGGERAADSRASCTSA